MAQISIPDALYQRLQATAQQQGVSLETIVQEALEQVGTPALLSPQEEQNLFDEMDRIADRNGKIPSEDWGKLVSDMRD